MSGHARSYKTRAVVLRSRNLGEADKIYTLFTDERGKLDAVAKGVRRAKSQIAGRLEFASEATLTMHRGRSLDVITGADILHTPWTESVEPARYATAHVIAELIDAFSEADLAQPEVYALLTGVLRALAASDDPAALVPRFELRLLGELGLAPPDGSCVRCERALEGDAAWADLDAGGLSCEACRPHRSDGLPLGPPDVANFRALAAPRGRGLRAAMRATPATARAIDALVTYHLGKRPKASRLLGELAPSGAREVSPALEG